MSIAIPLSYMAVVFLLSAIPDTGDPENLLGFVSPQIQSILHIPAYGFLAPLWVLTLRTYGVSESGSIRRAIILSSTFGGLTELYQTRVPGRTASVYDFLLDVAGVLLLTWLYCRIRISGRLR
jgi:VanZ family protein